jgi:hypothetical protein
MNQKQHYRTEPGGGKAEKAERQKLWFCEKSRELSATRTRLVLTVQLVQTRGAFTVARLQNLI